MNVAEQQPNFDTLLAYAPRPGLLDGRVIAITGAASGIGRAVADAAMRLGATLIALDHDQAALEQWRRDQAAHGAPVPEIVTLDLATATTVDYRQLADRLGTRFGRLDGLLNNAGHIGALTPFEHVEPRLFAQVMAINLVAPFFLTQWCMPLLKQAADPALVFSLHRRERAFWGPYGIAKAGQEALLHILADEYHLAAASPIRLVGIDPGPVATPERRRHYPAEPAAGQPTAAAVVGPYLYALGPDSRGTTDVVLRHC